MQLWDELLDQAKKSLNLLHQSRNNPKLPAYSVLEGEFNFNKTPLAPLETKALIYVDPKNRTSWEPHAKNAWYVGPVMKHYRCYQFWILKTKGLELAKQKNSSPHKTGEKKNWMAVELDNQTWI